MLFNHAPAAVSYTFDEPNLVSVAGLVPVMALAQMLGVSAFGGGGVIFGGGQGFPAKS